MVLGLAASDFEGIIPIGLLGVDNYILAIFCLQVAVGIYLPSASILYSCLCDILRSLIFPQDYLNVALVWGVLC